ncbi:hypothetical protein EI012_25955 [Escherichia coli]|nr:hypothetical protein [Escherichia coli]
MAEQPSKPNELLAGAKSAAEGAQSTLKNQTAKVATATGDLLDAVSKKANLDDKKGIGQYVNQGADYLHRVQGSNTPFK